VQWGVTWPLIENDGRPLVRNDTNYVASTGYPGSRDLENFLALDSGLVLAAEPALRSTYGDLRPIRVTGPGELNRSFVYPSGAGDPDAETVRRSFAFTRDGFRSALGRVSGTIYIGRTAAGGFGDRVDLDGDGTIDVKLSRPCGFLLQVVSGKVVAAEADRAVTAEIQGQTVTLESSIPVSLIGPLAN